MKRECSYWTPTSSGPKGCSLKRGHAGEHRCTDALERDMPTCFSGFGLGKMRLELPKAAFVADPKRPSHQIGCNLKADHAIGEECIHTVVDRETGDPLYDLVAGKD